MIATDGPRLDSEPDGGSEPAGPAGRPVEGHSPWRWLRVLYGSHSQAVLGSASSISLPGAVAYVLLGAALMTIRPGKGLMELAASPNPGGHTVRRLVVPSIVVPLLIGWIVQRGEKADLYRPVHTLAIVVLAITLFFMNLAVNGRDVMPNGGKLTIGTKLNDVADRHDGRIDLLVTDVVMPGLSGKALASAITRRRPRTKVLFMSGYSYNVIVHQGILDEGILDEGVTLLEKPFSAQLLLENVREVIECCKPAGHAAELSGEVG